VSLGGDPTPESPLGERFGWTAAVGDVNGDGYPDLAVTASYANAEGVGARTGRVNVYHGGGPDAGIFTGNPDRSLSNPSTNARFGISLGAGDLNADGVADLLVSANDFQQIVRIYLGSPNGVGANVAALTMSPVQDIHYDTAARISGDTDGDGIDDFVVGSALARRAYLFRGWSGRTPPPLIPATRFTGDTDTFFGISCY
jgi:hypothetical protein